jgi:uncharacterized protein (DUF1684 family)
MKSLLVTGIFILLTHAGQSQISYQDSIKHFINKYVATHDVLAEEDKKYLQFFPVDESYAVTADFKKATNAAWFEIPTSGKIKKTFRLYGVATFRIHDTTLTLHIYQSQNLLQTEKYSDYLFLPFTDLTTGEESYHTGRYIDLTLKDINGTKVQIDFNKAYNPSCAYVSGKYNCPIPPKENSLPVAIKAGEKSFNKPH